MPRWTFDRPAAVELGGCGWLRPQRRTAEIAVTVPPDCSVQLGMVYASTTISDVSADVSAMSGSGGLVATVSGEYEAQGGAR